MVEVANGVLVYIVDDDASVRRSLSRLMRSAGFVAMEYASAERFLAEVHNEPAGCVLLDVTMPRITGPQVQEQLTLQGITLPVIAVSARDDADTRNLARTLGAQFFFRKPVDDTALLDAIAWVMSSNQAGGNRPSSGTPR